MILSGGNKMVFNLIYDKWMPVRRLNGDCEKIAPWEITDGANSDNPIIEIASSRADFDGTLTQFLIGLVQTTMSPQNKRVWRKLWNTPPTIDELKSMFNTVATAFNFDGEGPRFMQDLTLKIEDCSEEKGRFLPSEQLLLDFRQSGSDQFSKSGIIKHVCNHCLATMLMSYQFNAPSGGRGYRVSIRGGGPLTIIIVGNSLWQTILLNVIIRDVYNTNRYGNPEKTNSEDIFPWMAPTHTSENNSVISLSDANPCRVYWAMPSRIIFEQLKEKVSCTCDVCGELSTISVSSYHTTNYGETYSKKIANDTVYLWTHPLTYYRTIKKSRFPILAKTDAMTYENFPLFTFGYGESREIALTISQFNDIKHNQSQDRDFFIREPRLWIFGYEFNRRVADCWRSRFIPLINIDNDFVETYEKTTVNMVRVVTHIAMNTQKYIKAAGLDLNGIKHTFFESTEREFYNMIYNLRDVILSRSDMTDVKLNWLKYLQHKSLMLYDSACQFESICNMSHHKSMESIISNRRKLFMNISKNSKTMYDKKNIGEILDLPIEEKLEVVRTKKGVD